MKKIFAFGQVTSGFTFTNRDEEKKRVQNNIAAGIHTVLISPRRWGKSSLVRQLAEENKDKNTVFCFLDIFSIKSEEEFYKKYAAVLLKATSGKTEELLANASKFLKSFVPSISLGDAGADIDLKLRLEEIKKSSEDIINLAETIATDKNITLVVCLDEFQGVADFQEGLSFQKKLRACWQLHKRVVYVLYGSRLSMMTDMFNKRNMPFYHFGDIFYLKKLSKAHLVAFITGRFEQTGKSITPLLAEKIADMMECHPHYVQHLSHFVWHQTDKEATENDIDDALQLLLDSYSPMFQRMYEELSRIQVNYLKAIADGHTTLITGKDLVEKYALGTPASVLKAIAALEKKEILDRLNSKTEFLDPVFKIWFKLLLHIS